MTDIQVTYDEAANAAYIYFDPGPPGAKVAHMYSCDPIEAGMINIDFDEDGRIIGVEVLAADAKLPQSLIDQAQRIGIDRT
ncbi:DUF2283 domain-containing protein [Actinophytocola glycyrrhizae]|uniref:DUF2283 domain-containing protein n=1 Tax=Actinophytocola glycyrrhizae TaxID=2044873 RepID=A0ABV9RVQ5_9PSEU